MGVIGGLRTQPCADREQSDINGLQYTVRTVRGPCAPTMRIMISKGCR
jgi:hypothetical protein